MTSGDGGIDGIVYKNNLKYLVQAKRYSNYINREHLADLLKKIHSKKANGGFFVHTGKTSKQVNIEYRDSLVKIISGENLIKLLSLELDNKV